MNENYFAAFENNKQRFPNWGDGKIHPCNTQIRVFQGILEFYGLECISAMAKTTPFRHSHEKWLNEFTEFKNKYDTQFAKAFFDYATLLCLAECRHAPKHCNWEIEFFPALFYDGDNRNALFNCPHFEPKSLLTTCAALFSDNNEWESQWGGEKWQAIANGALKYYDLPPVTFVDYMVDLSHNNGVFYNKGNHIFRLYADGYQVTGFLEYKRYQSPAKVWNECKESCSAETQKFFRRAVALGIIEPFYSTLHNLSIPLNERSDCDGVENMDKNLNAILGYVPIKWGTSRLYPSDIINADGWSNRVAEREEAALRRYRKKRKEEKEALNNAKERFFRRGWNIQ